MEYQYAGNRRENHVMPFLWVHGEEEKIYRRMVRAIYEANIRSFCVEARPHDGFCKDTWWRDMDIILDEAQKRGMRVWILDDKHFPTGYANGQAAKAPIELRRQGLLHKVFDVRGKRIRLNVEKQAHPPKIKPFMYLLTDTLNKNRAADCKFSDDRWYSVTAMRTDRLEEPICLDPFVREGKLEWTAPEGNWQVHLCFLSRNIGTHRSYINMMDRESCRILLDAVYEPHYAHYKDKFGTVVAGFFSDEPELGNNSMYKMYNTLGSEQDLPWSRELETALKERLGGEMPSLLPLLWCDGGDEKLAAKVRYHYMDCVSRLTEQDFSQQIGQWCGEHGVEYIGHVVEDNNQHARTGTSLGHYFRGLKGQSMAGIDDIGGQVEPKGEDKKKKSVFGYMDDGEFYHYALGKLGSSMGAIVPHMQGRTMCEIFGNYGWKEGVRLEKYLLDHFMVRGVNYFVPHAFTCSPYPEKDCPPHFYAQGNNPQYRHFGELMKYAERVCHMISGGSAVSPVAVLYHAEAEWCGKCMLIQKPARVLLDNQIDFQFVPADAFAEREFYRTEVTDALTVNGLRYETLVIPYAQFITKETAETIKLLMENGGRVFFLDGLPEGLCTGEELPAALKNCTTLALEELSAELEDLRTVGLEPANNRIRAMHYKGEKEFYYLCNEGDHFYRGAVVLPKGAYCKYDAWRDSYETAWMQDGRIPVEIAPSHSLFLIVGEEIETSSWPTLGDEKTILTHFRQSVCRAIHYPEFGDAKDIVSPTNYALTDKKFSGIIRYETTFEGRFRTLEITDAYEGVEAFLNDKSLGIQVAPPFLYDLRETVRDGENHLRIEVATTLERERGNIKNAAPTGIVGEVALYR